MRSFFILISARDPVLLRGMRPGLWLVSFLFLSCLSEPDPRAPSPPPAGDASGIKPEFTVAGVGFPDSAVLSRAFLSRDPDPRTARFLEKCRAGGTVRVGFLGGSITAGAGASRRSKRYSSLFTAALERRYPGLRVEQLNAGVGSTGSRYAASRAGRDLLDALPDLVLIEFAVNDFGEAPGDAAATLEGVVRQALLRNPEAPVVLLFMAKGDGRNAQAEHEAVGRHYALPMISWRDAVWPLIDAARLPWKAVFKDDPHPNNDGHRIAAHLLETWAARAPQSAGPLAPLPEPLFGDLYARAGALEPGDSVVVAQGSGWEDFEDAGRTGWRTTTDKAATLTLRTSARELTLGVRIDPHARSTVRVRVEGKPDLVLHNSDLFRYTRFVRVFSEAEALPRTVRVTHESGPGFTLDRVLYAGPPD
jgi:lysophospholipase L1-like esterase